MIKIKTNPDKKLTIRTLAKGEFVKSVFIFLALMAIIFFVGVGCSDKNSSLDKNPTGPIGIISPIIGNLEENPVGPVGPIIGDLNGPCGENNKCKEELICKDNVCVLEEESKFVGLLGHCNDEILCKAPFKCIDNICVAEETPSWFVYQNFREKKLELNFLDSYLEGVLNRIKNIKSGGKSANKQLERSEVDIPVVDTTPVKQLERPEVDIPVVDTERKIVGCSSDDKCLSSQFCLKGRCVSSSGMNWIEYMWEMLPNPNQIKAEGCQNMLNKYVAVDGNDGNDGSLTHPYKTIAFAIDQAEECTRINVKEGVYNEDVLVNNKHKIVLQGENRKSIIDAGTRVAGQWEPLTEGECKGRKNCGIYKLKINDSNFRYFLYINEKRVVPIRMKLLLSAERYEKIKPSLDCSLPENNTLDECNDSEEYRNERISKGIDILLNGPQLMEADFILDPDGWSNIYAAYFIDAKAKGKDYDTSDGSRTVYLKIFDRTKFNGIDDPNELVIVRPEHSGIRIIDANNVVVRGLTLKYGDITISRDVNNCTIEGNSILSSAKRAIYVYSQAVNPQSADFKLPKNININTNYIAPNYAFGKTYENNAKFMFSIIKAGDNDEHGIAVFGGGSGIQVHHNYLLGAMNGIQELAMAGWTENNDFNRYPENVLLEYNKGIDIHHNIIEGSHDDCLEPTSAGVGEKIHDNLLIDCADGLRTKMLPGIAKGPLYVYRNVFLTRDNFNIYEGRHSATNSWDSDAHKNYKEPPTATTNIYFFSGHEAKLYVFNNTFIGYKGITFGSNWAGLLAQNTYFINNIFSNKYSLSQWSVAMSSNLESIKSGISSAGFPLPQNTGYEEFAKRRIFLDSNIIGGIYAAHRHQDGGEHQPRYESLPPDMLQKYYRVGKQNQDLREERKDNRFWYNNPAQRPIVDIGDLCIPEEKRELLSPGINITQEMFLSYDVIAYQDNAETTRDYLINDTITIDAVPPGVVNGDVFDYIGAFKPDDDKSCKALKWLR